MDHFKNPRNMGEIKDPDGLGEVENSVCGDITYVYIKVSNVNGKEYIEDIKFQTFGCGAAIATSSMLTEIAKGKEIHEALEITREQIAEDLGGLPESKLHCSNLAADALHNAINDYLNKKKN